jgi:hypothetical protein
MREDISVGMLAIRLHHLELILGILTLRAAKSGECRSAVLTRAKSPNRVGLFAVIADSPVLLGILIPVSARASKCTTNDTRHNVWAMCLYRSARITLARLNQKRCCNCVKFHSAS